jgi:hypothetical protein
MKPGSHLPFATPSRTNASSQGKAANNQQGLATSGPKQVHNVVNSVAAGGAQTNNGKTIAKTASSVPKYDFHLLFFSFFDWFLE